jgi:hypothetical protein
VQARFVERRCQSRRHKGEQKILVVNVISKFG